MAKQPWLSLVSSVKMKKQKYAPSKRPLSWFFRHLIRDRLLFQFEARKERTGQKRITGVGLKAAKNLGWGVSLNPFNQLLCVNFSSIVRGKKVRRVLRESDEPSRGELLEVIADGLVKCVRSGFVIKDPKTWYERTAYPYPYKNFLELPGIDEARRTRYLDVFINDISNGRYLQRSPKILEFNQAIHRAMERVVLRGEDCKKSLDQACREIDAALAKR